MKLVLKALQSQKRKALADRKVIQSSTEVPSMQSTFYRKLK